MRSRLRWVPDRGEDAMVERDQPYAAVLLRFVVLVGLLTMPVLVFHWGAWFPFAGAAGYLLWELARTHRALDELARHWNERHGRGQEQEPLRQP
ncbi:hypothetical protein [Streptomyces scabiei]|uniref:hypothetical protein n=1 Tax=Streptomyces scabiei TaxID=1930 RepID=UPI001B31491F|nr:hypothetical protein [Streptomyces sp. LBUM 1488]